MEVYRVKYILCGRLVSAHVKLDVANYPAYAVKYFQRTDGKTKHWLVLMSMQLVEPGYHSRSKSPHNG